MDSCAEDAILFTIGDNDTFPLWYMQEVENHRTDIKLINTSLFQTDWYIDQMKRKTYEADPIPSQLTHDKYKWGTLDAAYYFEDLFPQLKDSVVDLSDFMRWVESENDVTYFDLDDDGIPEKVLPSNKIRVPVDKESVLRNGIVAEKDAHLIVPYIDITFDGHLIKNRILMLDILANNNWEKPIYFTGGAQADEEYIWMKDYLQLDAMTYKLVPIYTPNSGNFFEMGRINTDIMYENIKNWDWRNITDDDIYLDPETRKNSVSYRNNMERLARELMKEDQTEKAVEILDLAMEKMPVKKFDHISMVIGFAELYYQLNATEQARQVTADLIVEIQQFLTYYGQYDAYSIEAVFTEIERNVLMYNELVETAIAYDDEDYSNDLKEKYVAHLKLFDFLMSEE